MINLSVSHASQLLAEKVFAGLVYILVLFCTISIPVSAGADFVLRLIVESVSSRRLGILYPPIRTTAMNYL